MTLFELVGKIVIQNQEANEQIKETTGVASDASGGITGAFKKIGGAVATFFAADKIKDFGLSCINAVSDANAASSQFTQVFGDMEGQASKTLSGIADSAGISENRMKASFTKIASFAKVSGMDTESALSLSERAMIAVADSAAFYDRSLEDTTESLQSFLKGNFENDAALGLSCTETTRNAAANALYGKSFKDLSESQKQLTLLQMVEDANKASGALGQAARESNTWTNQTGNLKQAWTDFQAALGQPVIDYAVNACGWLAEKVAVLTEKFTTGTNPVQWFIDKVSALRTWLNDVGSYAATTFQPILNDLQTAFTYVKDAVQPFIDKLVEYVTSGQAADDMTSRIKNTIDLLASAYETAVSFIQSMVQGFQDAVTWGQQHETALTLIAIAVGTLTAAVTAYNIAQAIKKAGGIAEIVQLGVLQVQLWALTAAETAHTVATTIATAATSAFGAVLAFITSPITLVIVAIGALIAIGVALYKNWDTVKAKCSELGAAISAKWNEIKSNVSSKVNEMKSNVVNKFNEIKSGISDKINAARDAVRSAIDKMKSFFNFSWSLPKIKLPHFSISGSFSLNPPSVPHFSIEWYKKAMEDGMIMNDPTIFGFNAKTNQFMAGGEAGSETVVGTESLMTMIQKAVSAENAGVADKLDKLISMLAKYFPEIIVGMNRGIVLDSGALVAELAPRMDTKLGIISTHKGRGN